MSTYLSTCRFCKKCNYETPDEGMVKYGVRHWTHWTCGFAHFGIKGLVEKLTTYQCNAIPFKMVDSSPELQQALRDKGMELTSKELNRAR